MQQNKLCHIDALIQGKVWTITVIYEQILYNQNDEMLKFYVKNNVY